MIRQVLTLCLLMTTSALAHADIITLDNTPGGLGALVDETDQADLPAVFNIPGLVSGSLGTPITFTITAIAGRGTGTAIDVNSTATALGVNSEGTTDDDTDAFDSALNESITFEFGGLGQFELVSISQLDFTTFSSGEVFDFAGTTITNNDLSNGTTDVYDFGTPLTFGNGESITIGATAGTIGIEAFDLTVTSVPEPSSALFLAAVGVGAYVRRRRRK